MGGRITDLDHNRQTLLFEQAVGENSLAEHSFCAPYRAPSGYPISRTISNTPEIEALIDRSTWESVSHSGVVDGVPHEFKALKGNFRTDGRTGDIVILKDNIQIGPFERRIEFSASVVLDGGIGERFEVKGPQIETLFDRAMERHRNPEKRADKPVDVSTEIKSERPQKLWQEVVGEAICQIPGEVLGALFS